MSVYYIYIFIRISREKDAKKFKANFSSKIMFFIFF